MYDNPLYYSSFIILKIFQIIDQLLHAGHDGVAAAVGNTAEEHIKIGDLISDSRFKIAAAHGQLVEIGEHGQIVAAEIVFLHEKAPFTEHRMAALRIVKSPTVRTDCRDFTLRKPYRQTARVTFPERRQREQA